MAYQPDLEDNTRNICKSNKVILKIPLKNGDIVDVDLIHTTRLKELDPEEFDTIDIKKVVGMIYNKYITIRKYRLVENIGADIVSIIEVSFENTDDNRLKLVIDGDEYSIKELENNIRVILSNGEEFEFIPGLWLKIEFWRFVIEIKLR